MRLLLINATIYDKDIFIDIDFWQYRLEKSMKMPMKTICRSLRVARRKRIDIVNFVHAAFWA